ncbi:DUF2955 domain-containing protein [Enterovibrio nigricans]|uniref:Fusaric acid resistance protein-like n=1 Tax=Enterovibrio nigricans DSM 22720 TaxID=1121868 RepID=A0A1T4V4K5_9GAMM|nr:DUF2955 domain-containing protein [Enterovibrio nigricans]SKA59827.1 Protein of unknown function [Enterovibrio nigricans DSM 22720]
MFHNPGNGIIRLALFPVLLLFWQHYFGTSLPLIAPAICAMFLSTAMNPPPLKVVLFMGLTLFASAWFQAFLSNFLIDQPIIYYSCIYIVFYWCIERARSNPQDLLSIMLLLSTILVAVFTQQKGLDVSQIPFALLKEIMVAGLVAYLAYFLLPEGNPIANTIPSPTFSAVHVESRHILFKALVILIVLISAIHLNLVQSTIVTLTVALILKDPNPVSGHRYGLRRLLATYAGFLFAMPALLASALETNIVGQMSAALCCALLMGVYATRRFASFSAIQLLFSGYVVLIYYGLTQGAGSAFIDDGKRLFSILLAVLLGSLVLVLIQPSKRVSC